MAITYDTSASNEASSASITWNHTVTSASSNLLLVVSVAIDAPGGGDPVISATYNTVAMTKASAVEDGGGNARSELWYLAGPATGLNQVKVVKTLTKKAVVSSLSFAGVDQTTPVGLSASAQATSASPSVVVSSATNDLVVDSCAISTAAGTTITVGPGQTQRTNSKHSGNTPNDSTSTEPGAASVTMSWDISASRAWATAGVSIKPVSAAGVNVGARAFAMIFGILTLAIRTITVLFHRRPTGVLQWPMPLRQMSEF